MNAARAAARGAGARRGPVSPREGRPAAGPDAAMTGAQRRTLPRWVVICAMLMAATLLIALVDTGSLGIWLSSRHSLAPMSFSELAGLALAWGLITVVPWVGLVSTVVSSPLWAAWEKTALCLSPVLILAPVLLVRFSLLGGLVCSTALAAAALVWLLATGLRRARSRTRPDLTPVAAVRRPARHP